ncbi:MAG: hypothetical protein Tsb0020_20010 [Haliangiales bacterium]
MAQSRPSSKPSKRASKDATAKPSAGKRTSRAEDAASGADAHPTVAMVRSLAAIVEQHGLNELIVDLPDATLTLRRGLSQGAPEVAAVLAPGPAVSVAPQPPAAPPAPAPATPEPPAPDDHHVVTSPFVGTFYRRPNPDSEPYVALGARVNEGEVLCIVEAMKLMNEIEADAVGTVTAILVEDGEPVEYGQALFKIAPL